MVEQTPSHLTPETYFPRIDQYREWYDKKAVWAKSRYLSSKILVAICAIIIPIVTNIDTLPYVGNVSAASNAIVTILGLMVASSVGLENVLKYKDQWVNYRSTEQFLVRERILYDTRSGPYEKLDDVISYHRFISVCEDAIQNENQATLNVLTREETNNRPAGK